ncbi:MAG: bifunctional phosphoribosylaminoimidazolecarboxamide formyltransferase/IMP cyclohydrolase [Anaerolineales bacterium]
MKTALISLSNKIGLIPFAQALTELGWNLLASGGTAATLRAANLPVQEVADYTGSPEILNGRVKTLHPAIHGGLLARDLPQDAADLQTIHARPIDLVAVNLYPFAQAVASPQPTLENAIENIDIGGVALIRAAAKNYQRVTILTNPADYAPVLEELRTNGSVSLTTRQRLAIEAFSHTAAYDAAIHTYLATLQPETPANLHLALYPVQTLRYGENPHQQATLYAYEPGSGPMGGKLLQGKALSYNNLLDLDAAWRAAQSYTRPTVAIVKHLSPCGIASAETLAAAYPAALESDPISAFGGVIAVNQPFDVEIAQSLGKLFVECIAAPEFTPEALAILASKKNLRLVEMPRGLAGVPRPEIRSIIQGVLCQTLDVGDPPETEWRIVSQRPPTPEEQRALEFAWKACQHVKSNAIVFAQGEATVGIGGGQPNRVDCVRIAAQRAGEKAQGAVMASDAFFPFPDSIEEAAKAGITAIIHPGGSVRDEDSIAAANAHNIALVVTGVRHFRH